MPDDVETVIADLFVQTPVDVPHRKPRSVRRLDGGVFALDYGDEGHTFEVTVERIPRRQWVPSAPVRIGHVAGIDVELTRVTADSCVRVHLSAASTLDRDRLTRDYNEAFERWAATATQTQANPPDQPANRLMQITITLNDSLGTVYRSRARQYGGSGTEWEGVHFFDPRPPIDVHELSIILQAPNQPAISVAAPLQTS